jgi:hypothetical protein
VCLFDILQAMGFKKLYGPGFRFLRLGIMNALDSGLLSGRKDAKLGLRIIWLTSAKAVSNRNLIQIGFLR